MSAETNPQPSPNQREDLVARFHREYRAALADARTAAEHTGTEGWQALYAKQRDDARDSRRDMAKRLKNAAQTLEDFGLSEDGEKSVKDIMKESATLREANEAFKRQVIDRVTAPVMTCERIAEHFLNEARRQEHDAPLHNVGLEHLMKDAVASESKPSFDDDTGIVTVSG